MTSGGSVGPHLSRGSHQLLQELHLHEESVYRALFFRHHALSRLPFTKRETFLILRLLLLTMLIFTTHLPFFKTSIANPDMQGSASLC